MGIDTTDRSWEHLYPDFRERLKTVFAEIENKTGEPWLLFEGYRSAERQTYLYSLGRTRPGAIVTWMRTPKYHGTGLAADCYPSKEVFNAPQSYFRAFRDIYLQHGLINPAWEKGDRGHVQLSDAAVRQKALAWVRNGFKDLTASTVSDIKVYVDDELIPDAKAYLEAGHAWVTLRPVTDALDLTIAHISTLSDIHKAELVSDNLDITVPLVIKNGTGYAQATTLPVPVIWDAKTKSIHFKEK